MILLRVLLFLLGVAIIVRTLISAVRTIVLPRGERDRIAAFVFLSLRRLYNIARCQLTMAPYAPWSSDRSLLRPV